MPTSRFPYGSSSEEHRGEHTQGAVTFQYLRLPFGISSAPRIFTMKTILQDLPHVCVYLDDILITGPTEQEHLTTREEVPRQLDAAGVRLKCNKCAFMLPSIKYLGTLHLCSRSPTNQQQDQSSQGGTSPNQRLPTQVIPWATQLLYGKFVHSLSTVLAPLRSLLHKHIAWTWGPNQQSAFDHIKNLLTSDTVLAHYDQTKVVVLACDASPYGIDAVLSHTFPGSSERPIAYASRTLGPAEKRYYQLDKGLAIIFGVKRFHQYLAGRYFTISSDHEPLQHLFQETNGIPTLASAQIQRWALTLRAYDYTTSTTNLAQPMPKPTSSADCHYLTHPPEKNEAPGETTLTINMLQSLPVTAKDVCSWTACNPTLSKVRTMLSSGWKDCTDYSLKPFTQHRDELSLDNGCILWGSHIVIPPQVREKVLNELHQGHLEIARPSLAPLSGGLALIKNSRLK